MGSTIRFIDCAIDESWFFNVLHADGVLMRFVTIQNKGHAVPGVVIGDDVLDLKASQNLIPEAGGLAESVRDILAGGDPALSAIKRIVDRIMGKSDMRADLTERGALAPLRRTKLMAPIFQPTLILSCGMNYHAHLREMNTPVPKTPTAFTKNAASVIGSSDPIVLPKAASDMVDWEGEFSVVIGKPCFGVKAADAINHVAGCTIINDVSARNWVAPIFKAEGTSQFSRGSTTFSASSSRPSALWVR
jgi:acylpyruvate hydrolase